MTEPRPKPHWTHWVIAGLLLLWNALGSANFLFQSDPNYVASLPDTYKEIIATRPAWATVAFGVSVFGGVIGALLLIFRTNAAVWALGASAIGGTLATLDAFTWGGVMQIATAGAAAIYAWISLRHTYPGEGRE